MHRSFLITEEERKRILGIHESATQRQYLNEQQDYSEFFKFGKGCIYGDCQNGKGTFVFDNGNKYTGEWKNDKKEGQGTFVWVNGDKYTGEWKNNYREGQGTHIFQDGSKYIGEHKNSNFEGKGTYVNKGSGTWTGQWKDGNPVGTTWDDLEKRASFQTQAWPKELEVCLKASGGRLDSQNYYWVKYPDDGNGNGGEYGFSTDGTYHKEGSNYHGYYYCNGNKIQTTREPVTYGGKPKSPQNQQQSKYPQYVGKNVVTNIQNTLLSKGYDIGKFGPDGKLGPDTTKALLTAIQTLPNKS